MVRVLSIGQSDVVIFKKTKNAKLNGTVADGQDEKTGLKKNRKPAIAVGLLAATAIASYFIISRGRNSKSIKPDALPKNNRNCVKDGRKEERKNLQKRLNEFKEGKILEFTLSDNGNNFVVKDGKIISYKNKDGIDLLVTFDNASGMDLIYKTEIEKIISKVNEKDKEYLKLIDNVKLENSETVISSKDLQCYINNKNFPAWKMLFKNGASQECRQGFDADVYIFCNEYNKIVERDVHFKDGRTTHKIFYDTQNSNTELISKRTYVAFDNEGYKIVKHTCDGKAETFVKCDAQGEPLKFKTFSFNDNEIKSCNWENDVDFDLWRRQVRDTKNKGKILSDTVIRSTDLEKEAEIVKTIIPKS